MSDTITQAFVAALSRLTTVVLEDDELRRRLRQLAQAVLDATLPLPAEPAEATATNAAEACQSVGCDSIATQTQQPAAPLVATPADEPLKFDTAAVAPVIVADPVELPAKRESAPEIATVAAEARTQASAVLSQQNTRSVNDGCGQPKSVVAIHTVTASDVAKGFETKSVNRPTEDSALDALCDELMAAAVSKPVASKSVDKDVCEAPPKPIVDPGLSAEQAASLLTFAKQTPKSKDWSSYSPPPTKGMFKGKGASKKPIQNVASPIASKKLAQQQQLLGQIKFELEKLTTEPALAVDHWKTIAGCVTKLVNNGLPASDRALRNLLAPHIDDLPDLDMPVERLMEVAREIESAAHDDPSHRTDRKHEIITPEVIKAAALMNGSSMVFIGGDPRARPEQLLKNSLKLKELYWIPTRHHRSSTTEFEHYVSRADVSVVLLAIRWASHSYGDVRAYCNQYGKCLVRLPGGYNPAQVALQIISQCSDRLKDRSDS